MLLLRIEGHVAEDPVEFWRANADLALIASQALPRQVFMYYCRSGPKGQRREGFLVAQRGQVLASDEGADDRPEAEQHWPVTKLCAQMQLTMDELALGFPGAPRVSIALVDPGSDDQALLMALMGRDPTSEATAKTDAGDAAAGTPAATTAAPSPRGRAAAEEDAKRRATEQATEQAELRRRAEQLQSGLAYDADDLGVVVAPTAALSEPDLLRGFVVGKIAGDLPAGLPAKLADELQGKRCDLAVRVEFMSEVFVDENKPLSKSVFAERATPLEIGGRSLRGLEVLAPRVGYGTLVSDGSAHVFVSRKREAQLPARLVLRLLDG
jgi:hypothetical protein